MSTQKGLKFTKGKKVDDSVEVSFDALEEKKNDKGKGRRRSLENSVDESVASKKKRTSNASNVSSSSRTSKASTKSSRTTSTKSKRRHIYPSQEFVGSEKINECTSHAKALQQLVEEVINHERTLLQTFSKEEGSKTIAGRKYIFESLDAVLAELPALLEQDCPSNAQFTPEGKLPPSAEVTQLLAVKKALMQHSDKLSIYENDISKLAEDCDLWMNADSIIEKTKISVANSLPLSASNETETLSLYKELLGEIERHCAELLASEVPSREAVWKARQAQDALYDAINKVRMEQAGKAKAPTDAKDILKKMPSLF